MTVTVRSHKNIDSALTPDGKGQIDRKSSKPEKNQKCIFPLSEEVREIVLLHMTSSSSLRLPIEAEPLPLPTHEHDECQIIIIIHPMNTSV